MDILQLFGNATHLVVAAREGLILAGIRENEVNADFATFAGGDGKILVRDAAFRYALALSKERGRIADWIDLGRDDTFVVDEYIDLAVEEGLSPDEIARRSNLSEEDWEYISTPPAMLGTGTRKMKAAIGRLGRDWTEEEVEAILARPGSPLRGSGAWAREAYLAVRPDYDGKGWIGFPDPDTSRWRFRHGGDVCFPYLWRGYDWRWDRDLGHVGSRQLQSRRLCLLCE